MGSWTRRWAWRSAPLCATSALGATGAWERACANRGQRKLKSLMSANSLLKTFPVTRHMQTEDRRPISTLETAELAARAAWPGGGGRQGRPSSEEEQHLGTRGACSLPGPCQRLPSSAESVPSCELAGCCRRVRPGKRGQDT